MNSIAVYMCHEILHHWFPVDLKVPMTHGAQLAIQVYGASLWLIMSVVMYYYGIFIAI